MKKFINLEINLIIKSFLMEFSGTINNFKGYAVMWALPSQYTQSQLMLNSPGAVQGQPAICSVVLSCIRE